MMQNTNETLFDIKAEAAVIASILAHPDYMMFCQDLLKPNYFYSKDNSCLYWACQEIVVNKGIENLDAFNLTTIIESNKAVSKTINKFNLPPMEEYIAMSKIIARNTIEEFTIVMNRVIELSFKRSLKSKAMSIVTACESDMSLDDLNNLTSNSIDSVVDEYVIGNDIKTIGERADELWQETQDRRTSNGLYGIPSKFEIINNYFTYEKGELVFLSARMKRGKSLFMMCCAIHKARLGIPTIYFDTL